jgi:cellobiose transport system substrate-binding protein
MSSRSRTTSRLSRVLAVVIVGAVGAAGLAACSSSSKSNNTGNDANAKVTLKVGLFGTFGFKEAGLYDQYMKDHPNVTIVEDSVEQENNYYQALQTHLAAGSGLDDIQGIEVGRIADVVANQSDKFVNLNDLGASSAKSSFYDWKWQAATTKDGKTLGLGTDVGPLAICYRPDLFAAAGLPSNRDQVSALWSSWDGFLAAGEKYKAGAKGKSSFTDSASGLFNAMVGQSENQYYDTSGKTIYNTNPAVKTAWDTATKAATSGLTAKLKQFDPAWNTGFAAGSFATIACPAWMIGYIKGQAGDAGKGKWDVASIPGGGGNWGGSYLSIPKASKNQKAGYDLVQWLTAPTQQVTMWAKGQHFPSSSTAAADPSVASATDSWFDNAPVGKIFNESASNLKVAIIGPKDGVIKDQFTNALVSVEQQSKSPDAAWSAAMAGIKNAIGD